MRPSGEASANESPASLRDATAAAVSAIVMGFDGIFPRRNSFIH